MRVTVDAQKEKIRAHILKKIFVLFKVICKANLSLSPATKIDHYKHVLVEKRIKIVNCILSQNYQKLFKINFDVHTLVRKVPTGI